MRPIHNMKEKIYLLLPNFFQNILISLFNYLSYKKRYGGDYKLLLEKFKKNENLPFKKLLKIQKKEFKKLVNHSVQNSIFYNEKYKNIKIDQEFSLERISELPIIDKEMLRENISNVYTIDKSKATKFVTGGTTGKSLEVLATYFDNQMGYALLDNFRAKQDYKLGEKTAWFSGKNIISNRDVKKNRFWKTDFLYKVRYYSTFHIKQTYLNNYLDNLKQFKPKFIVGFPSSIYEIAKYGLNNNVKFPKGIVRAVFPTAENVTKEIRDVIESFFSARIYDQYASSEGAPCIFECHNKNLHIEMQHGVFECLDDNNKPAISGRLVVTSFTTYGTPLIRYDIGDGIALSERNCDCGNNNPLVDEIYGRENDFIYSKENGKINLGNISNCLKGVNNVVKFQIIQSVVEEINIKMIVDKRYTESDQKIFIKNFRDRLGNKINIKINIVNDIKSEKSGKFRMVKNSIPKKAINDIGK